MRATIAAAALTLAALAVQPAAAAQSDNNNSGQICLSSPIGGPLCQFQTMAQCRQALLPATTQHCFDRSENETTVGSGGNSPSSSTVGSGSNSPSSPTGGAPPLAGYAR
jgi:hypothetical protein